MVSGEYTTTGKPLLANDPHLAPQMPSLWYQMGLHCRTVRPQCQYDVTGFTFSGMPGVVIGHNQDIAWGMTNLGADVTDLYLEKVNADGYLYDGKQQPFTTRKETIKVAGGESQTITVRATNNGPLVSDRSDELATVGKDGARRQRRPGPRRRLRRRAALDRARPRQVHGRGLRTRPGQGLRPVPQGRRALRGARRRT